ncbi:hypothetical protein SBRCBS47491_003591 [Sporothrix bragantina]|uniref:Inhibitor of growth protein N-terminal histone-binding domain-containing protein n=1 Tax=Sporothrix bragantina TaxID=671064 RepID=A0ABP0BGN8_9PEZI
MSVAADAGNANGGVSPKNQMTPQPLRTTHVSPPPIPSLATGTGAAGHEAGEDGHTSDHEAAAPEPFPAMGRNGLNAFSLRADPDAQATVTDFLDFTEYLPSDMERSLTLIAKLDETYIDSSTKVHRLTDTWGLLPSLPRDSRPNASKLRADISANLRQGHNARVYSHAEALRMAENVNRHYYRAKTILSKLRTSLENYPEAEQQQQAQQQQKQQQQQQQREHEQQQLQQQQARGGAPKLKKSDGQQRMRRQRVPRITVPGEVLAPYEVDYDTFSGESDVSSPSSEDESPPPTMRRKSTPGTQSRIKLLKAGGGAGDVPRVPKIRVPRESRVPGQPYISTSSALARLKPPPENAVIGSADAPWLRLTAYELAKLRKRMKKNAQWSPSETMIARELKALGRNLDAFNQAKRKAEADGREFEGLLPEASVESDGVTRAPLGALSVDAAIAAEDNQLSNRGMKLNEAKKMKNRWAQLAAQEAEESTRRMMEAARAILSPYPATAPDPAATAAGSGSLSARATTPAGAAAATATSRKRKRDGPAELADSVEGADLQKRVKTETPVPIPLHAMGSVPPHEGISNGNGNGNGSGNGSSNTLATPANPPRVRHSMTPVPAPVFGAAAQDANTNNASLSRQSTTMSSPLSSSASSMAVAPAHASSIATTTTTTTTTVPLKPPAETPIHPPVHKSTTPIHPPVRELRAREPVRTDQPQDGEDVEDTGLPLRVSRASSRAVTPNPANALGVVGASQPTTGGLTPGSTTSMTTGLRRPPSRGASAAAPSTDAQTQSLAAERPRRASTARNTPAPEVARLATTGAGKRVKRPAPGVVSRTSSGGSAAVGQRKAAPRKKRGSNAHQQRHKSTEGDGDGDVEVDDDGNVIDPNEPRYCVCNRVSFGTMIQCDNIDVGLVLSDSLDGEEAEKLTGQNCKQEWFHLECVGMTAVPARTTKWYCPDCRVLLNIGEKGEVSARGVKM